MKFSHKFKRMTAVALSIAMAVSMMVPGKQVKASGEAENFSVWLDDLAKGGEVEPGVYTYGGSTLTLVGEADLKYTIQGDGVVINGEKHNTYKAGKRHANANEIPEIPADTGAGTLTKFVAAAEGMFTIYFNSTSFLRIHDFNTEDGVKNTTKDTGLSLSQYSFHVIPGHTYVMSTTGKTNNMFYAGYSYIVDEKIENPVKLTNVDASLTDTTKIMLTDVALGGDGIEVKQDSTEVTLLKGHTYQVSSNDGGVKPLIGEGDTFVADGSEAQILLYNVPDETLTGKLTGVDASVVTKLTFKNKVNGQEYVATINGDSYTCQIKPGEYATSVETTDGSKTYDRVSVKANSVNTNEVYVESTKSVSLKGPFKTSINVPGDYSSINQACEAIRQMENRPVGEEGRVTINLTADLFEQAVITQSYVTLNGNGHEIAWYYGVGTLYYSVHPDTGLYSERLARDKYSYAEGNGNLWGGVFIVRGDNFIAHDTTFRNTYNYYLTDAEKSDIAGSVLSVNRLADGADVSQYAYKERSNAFYIEANNVECYNCKILSSQDTLGRNGSTNNNYHVYFKNCVIGGNVDYICGEFSAVFDECELQWKTYKNDAKNNAKIGYICAPKTSSYVFRNCVVTTTGDEGEDPVLGLWGRTWGANSNACFMDTETNGMINADGWGEMNSGDSATAKFKEYNNTSKGVAFVSNGTAEENKTIDAVVRFIDTAENSVVTTVLGRWRPTSYKNPFEPEPTPTPVPTATPVPTQEITNEVETKPTDTPTPVVSDDAQTEEESTNYTGIMAIILLLIVVPGLVAVAVRKNKKN